VDIEDTNLIERLIKGANDEYELERKHYDESAYGGED
jgi:hypothetical protein